MAELKIKADSGGGTVSLKGPATTTSNAAVQLTLPVDDGTTGQYLKTNGSGVLSWATVDTSIADDSIVEAKLDVSNAPTNGQFLQAQSGEGGGLTWATPASTSIETKYLDPGTTNASNLDFGTSGSLLSTNTKSWQIAISELGQDGTADIGVQLGYGSTPTYHSGTNYYQGWTVYHYNPGTADGSSAMSNDNYVRTNWNMNSSANKMSGMIRGQHISGNKWMIVFDLIFKTSEHPICSTGTWWTTAMSGALTSVRIRTSETFDSGVLNYTGIVS